MHVMSNREKERDSSTMPCGGRPETATAAGGAEAASSAEKNSAAARDRGQCASGREEKLRVLILSAPIGSGHRMAALALEQALEKAGGVEVVQRNVFDFFPRFLGSGFLSLYRKVLTFCPALYAFSYRLGNRSGGSLFLRNAMNRLFLWMGRPFLERVRPQVVLSTHATPTGILSCYKKERPGFFLGVVVTDFTVHRWLLCPGVDAYFLGAESLVDRVRDMLPASYGQPELEATGIPLRQRFVDMDSSGERFRALRRRMGWAEDAFVCLLLGGGDGLLPMKSLLGILDRLEMDKVHLVAVTGNNRELEEELRQLAEERHGTRVSVRGFVEDLPDMLAAADAVVSKAGGLTAAECLASGTPLVIYNPLPGQEAANTMFLLQQGCARAAYTVEEVAGRLEELLELAPEERRERKALRRLEYGHPDAADRIVSYILKKENERES